MGGASGLLVLAAIGYFWLNLVTYFRYYISKLSGYHVLFLSLLFGSAHYWAAHLLLYMMQIDSLGYSFDRYLASLNSEWPVSGEPKTILLSVIGAAFLAAIMRVLLLPWHLNIIRWMTKRKGYLIEDALSESLINHISIKIYSRNEKFYVAYAVNTPEAPIGVERLSEIKLLLVSSGFVSKEDGTEKIVEDYLGTFNENIFENIKKMANSDLRSVRAMEETYEMEVSDLPTIVIPVAEITLIKTDTECV